MATLTSRRLPLSPLTPRSVNAPNCIEQRRCNLEAAGGELARRTTVRMAYKHELAEAQELSAPTGAIVYHAVRKEGEDELERNTSALAWSGLAAGMSMGFSFAAEALLRAALPEASWRPLITKLGYSVGFVIVVLARQQLFTENTLTVILPALRRRDSLMFANVMRLWTTVLLANLVGAAVFAWVVARAPVFQPDVQAA